MKLDDNQLTALALRNYAQTCEEIGYASSVLDAVKRWQERADRCRALAALFEKLAKAAPVDPGSEPS